MNITTQSISKRPEQVFCPKFDQSLVVTSNAFGVKDFSLALEEHVVIKGVSCLRAGDEILLDFLV